MSRSRRFIIWSASLAACLQSRVRPKFYLCVVVYFIFFGWELTRKACQCWLVLLFSLKLCCFDSNRVGRVCLHEIVFDNMIHGYLLDIGEHLLLKPKSLRCGYFICYFSGRLGLVVYKNICFRALCNQICQIFIAFNFDATCIGLYIYWKVFLFNRRSLSPKYRLFRNLFALWFFVVINFNALFFFHLAIKYICGTQ